MSEEKKKNPRSGGEVTPSTGSELGFEEFKRAQYTFGVPGQANKYNRTTKAIAEYAKITYGKEMWKLVNESVETTFTEPPEPNEKATRAQMEKYKMKLGRCLDDEKKYNNNKTKIFGIIMGKCHVAMRNKVESLPDFKTLEEADDVVELLKRLKELAYSTDKNQYEYWTMQATMRKMITMRQDPKESLLGYSKRFLAQLEVTEVVWGELTPSKLKGKPLTTQEEAGKKFAACLFLAGVDRGRYGKAIDEMNNNFVQGTASYPVDVSDMLKVLTNRSDAKSSQLQAEQDGVSKATSFAQRVDRRRCHKCGVEGHIARTCPEGDDNASVASEAAGSVGTTERSVGKADGAGRSKERKKGWSGYQGVFQMK